MTTGIDPAIVPCPLTGMRAWKPESVRSVASVVSVAAPEGSGSDVALTGCVAWQNAPDTGTADARSCASVSGPVTATLPDTATVPEMGCTTPEPSTGTG